MTGKNISVISLNLIVSIYSLKRKVKNNKWVWSGFVCPEQRPHRGTAKGLCLIILSQPEFFVCNRLCMSGLDTICGSRKERFFLFFLSNNLPSSYERNLVLSPIIMTLTFIKCQAGSRHFTTFIIHNRYNPHYSDVETETKGVQMTWPRQVELEYGQAGLWANLLCSLLWLKNLPSFPYTKCCQVNAPVYVGIIRL